MRKALILVALSAICGCAKADAAKGPVAADAAKANGASSDRADAPLASDGPRTGYEPEARRSSTWIGAAPEGDLLAAGTVDTFMGVWVDVPEVRPEERPPMEIVLVVDTSGSMAGPKLDNARAAAATLVKNLKDGDIVALDAFSEHARQIVPPTRISAETREAVLREIAKLSVAGSTNMFEGLSLAEGTIASAPPTHTVRRVVMISDGIANVGPSSPETLGMIAERGLRFRAQVTSLGVGNDYDERTLNALAIRSSGRLFHLSDPEEMASILKNELRLLDATLASESEIEIVPAPGVAVLGAEGVHAEWHDGGLRIPLGALHAGQHREALVRVHITDPAMFEGSARSLASVRLRFRDAQEHDLERIQEVVAKTSLTADSGAVARSVNSRTKAIAAIADAAKTELAAAQRINDGNFGAADKDLERAQQTLAAQAQVVSAPAEKKRLEAAANRVAVARASAAASAARPKAVQRDEALKLNAGAMHESGF